MTGQEFRRIFRDELYQFGYHETWSEDGKGALLQGYYYGSGCIPLGETHWAADITVRNDKARVTVYDAGKLRDGADRTLNESYDPPSTNLPWQPANGILGGHKASKTFQIVDAKQTAREIFVWLALAPKHHHIAAHLPK